MSEYKGIRGWKVQTVSTDPAASILATGAWASGGTMNNPYSASGGDGGTSSAAFAAGGASGGYNTTHEQYDGSTWTTATGMNTARGYGGAGGTTTAAFVATGRINPTSVTANTELWNGSAWTEVNNVNTGRFATGGGIGTQTAGLIAPGSTVPTVIDSVESWDGTNWTAVTTYPGSAHEGIILFGTNTSAIFAGGYGGPPGRGGDALYKDAVFEWNGSTFSAETNLPTIRGNAAGVGTTTDGLVSGGWEGSVPAGGTVANTTYYDGTTWTELNNLATAAQGWGSSKGGATSDTIVFGGGNALTEEWTTAPAPSFQQENLGQVFYNSTSNAFKVTKINYSAGTWASNTVSPTATTEKWGTGLSNSDALIGTPAGVAMEWNGSAWTDGGTVNNTANAGRGGTGGISAALLWGGTSVPAATESYNGTAWTEVNDLNTGGNNQPAGPTGTYTDLIAAGRGPGWAAVSESWNGTSWTETSDLSTARRALGSSGSSSTNCAVFGGNVPPNTSSALTETWNGTSWTEVADLNTARFSGMGFGDSSATAGYVAGSSFPSLPPYNTKTEFFNGTAWTEVNDLTNGRYHNKGGGSGASALTAGGYLASPAGGTTTENYVWEASTGNSTITVS